MSITLYDATVPLYISGFKTLAHVLKKAQAFAEENKISEADFLSSRLIADQLPLPFQIQNASKTARFTVSALTGAPLVVWENTETTFAELQDLIARTIKFVQEADKSKFGGDVNAEIQVPQGTHTRISYVQAWGVPNFYFHAVTAYAILRAKGVQIGKGDYLKPT
jgi:hypothetical protein